MFRRLLPALLLLALALTACGTAADQPVGAPADADPAAGTCLEGTEDCVDTPGLEDGGDPVPLDETGIDQRRRDAEAILGMEVDALGDTVRIARRGGEQFALTEDYQIGRITVEVDEIDGVEIVTSATVELPDGPETFTLE